VETVTSPSTTYTTSEWNSFPMDTFDGLGSHITSGGTSDIEAPSAPTNLSANSITETTLNLTWNAATDNVGVTAYEVFKDGLFLVSTVATSYTVTNLTTATSYAFTVAAKDNTGNVSIASSVANITTLSGAVTPQILFAHSFETGWDGWVEGGSDCYRINSSMSFDGNYSIRIRDNSGIQSAMTSSTYDVSAFDTLEIKFNFYSSSMEAGEDFWLLYFDGSTWQTIQAFVSGIDFNNNAFTEATVTISSATSNFPTNAQFRFQCDASSNSDNIYIDNVIVTANAGLAAKNSFKTIFSKTINNFEDNFKEIEDLEFYPNPASNNTLLRTEIDVEDDIVDVQITIVTLQGKLVKSFEMKSLKKEYIEQNIDVSNLKSGIYFVNITSTKGLNITKKLMVK
ncbi:T9SS type A sorting domain-containing protein, partial [Lutibacter sp.]|uniref:T9SS type A sorting domain-containing protein n=1 Tax=Lutibacter sp. TaxID=1925666 RepID=UPI003562C67D